MPTQPEPHILGRGLYTYPEAAMLTRLRSARVREWFASTRPFLVGDYPAVDGDRAISFLDLIDVLVAGKLRDAGASLQALRAVYCAAARQLGPHPFARHQWCVEVLRRGQVHVYAMSPDGDSTLMLDVGLGQYAARDILKPFSRQIDYDPRTDLALRWRIGSGVVIDPAICFGKPIVERVGKTVEGLVQAYRANGNDAKVVANWHGVAVKDVLTAVDWERSLAA